MFFREYSKLVSITNTVCSNRRLKISFAILITIVAMATFYAYCSGDVFFSTNVFSQIKLEKENDTATDNPANDKDKNHPWYGKSLNILDYVQPDVDTTIISNKEICVAAHPFIHENSSSPFLLIAVISPPGNIEGRQVVRDTWLSMGYANWTIPFSLRSIFFLGKTMNESLQKEIFDENIRHGDIVQEGAFIESYLNLTLKTVHLMKWITNYCPHTKFIFKVDDDMYVNTPLIVEYILSPQIRNRTNLISGNLLPPYGGPIRNPNLKWYVPEFMYSEKVFPASFVTGAGYIISGPLVPQLFKAALTTPFVSGEDAYLTGIVAHKIGVQAEKNSWKYYMKNSRNLCDYRYSICMKHTSQNFDEIRSIWHAVNGPNCTNSSSSSLLINNL